MFEQNYCATLTMATSNGDSSAANKAFIIQHMNADHQDSLVLYLQAYCHVSAGDAKSAQLEDISLSDLVIFTVCLATYIGFAQRSNFLPGSIIYESLGLGKVPSFTQFCYDIQPLLLPGMVGIHLLEAGLLAVVRLRPHRVPFLSGVWFAWMASTFIEGFGAFQRTGQMVKEERVKREQSK